MISYKIEPYIHGDWKAVKTGHKLHYDHKLHKVIHDNQKYYYYYYDSVASLAEDIIFIGSLDDCQKEIVKNQII